MLAIKSLFLPLPFDEWAQKDYLHNLLEPHHKETEQLRQSCSSFFIVNLGTYLEGHIYI